MSVEKEVEKLIRKSKNDSNCNLHDALRILAKEIDKLRSNKQDKPLRWD